MASYETVLFGLKNKVEQIISKYELLLSDNKRLKNQLDNCKDKLELSNNKIKELEEKIDNLQLVEAFKSSAVDVKEAKQNIRSMVREIDNCIALLND